MLSNTLLPNINFKNKHHKNDSSPAGSKHIQYDPKFNAVAEQTSYSNVTDTLFPILQAAFNVTETNSFESNLLHQDLRQQEDWNLTSAIRYLDQIGDNLFQEKFRSQYGLESSDKASKSILYHALLSKQYIYNAIQYAQIRQKQASSKVECQVYCDRLQQLYYLDKTVDGISQFTQRSLNDLDANKNVQLSIEDPILQLVQYAKKSAQDLITYNRYKFDKECKYNFQQSPSFEIQKLMDI